jgi:hypothetical protein
MCLIGLEVLSAIGLLLDPGGTIIGEETHMIGMAIFRWSQHIGVVHLLCIFSFLGGASMDVRHILWGQQGIFNQDGSR